MVVLAYRVQAMKGHPLRLCAPRPQLWGSRAFKELY